MFKNLVTDVFFDLDHTLWDFEKNSALTFKKIFEQNGVNVVLSDFLKVYIPINLQYWKLYREERVTKAELRYQRLKKAFDSLGVYLADDSINILSEDYIEHLSTFNHIFPGTIEILDYLKPNYRLHIITNGFEEIQEKKLRTSNIRDYFEVIVNSEMAGVKKPDPKIFQLALNRAQVEPESALMIGDSLEADIIGAKNLGIHVLHFNSHQEPRHEVSDIIHHLDEIKSFL
ncbi:YjjG family noncanonical pyrimidine nucleotidase [Croceitalea rosinachiae]|uniref:YjjG family noncanonical pyrimidine nucleotidase n=1 Tax=Croceitalea rosinachiae TaxID=3075596 RepID=A0ABU3AD56_9FLAO|nr:YjjG family noncanonical pyrimidine nucleotidase [Croceitalea sp. F388]MDT0607919.1 YjjG family noncanonical pyrimidine nucleotidase [Croceitalea sp. F388]